MLPEELLKQVGEGNRNAFKELYELFKDRVYNTCLSHLHSQEEAEEATQDIFVEIYNKANTFQSNAAVATWIYRIAVNKCIDRIRYKKRHKRFGIISSLFKNDSVELGFDPPELNHPGIVFEKKELAVKLFQAIAKLPENQQSAFILKQVEGVSQKEIAQILDMSEKAVESLLQRAKSKLRGMLGDIYNETKD